MIWFGCIYKTGHRGVAVGLYNHAVSWTVWKCLLVGLMELILQVVLKANLECNQRFDFSICRYTQTSLLRSESPKECVRMEVCCEIPYVRKQMVSSPVWHPVPAPVTPVAPVAAPLVIDITIAIFYLPSLLPGSPSATPSPCSVAHSVLGRQVYKWSHTLQIGSSSLLLPSSQGWWEGLQG